MASTNVDDYKQAKISTQKLEHDFTVMVKIASSIAKLHHDYEARPLIVYSTLNNYSDVQMEAKVYLC